MNAALAQAGIALGILAGIGGILWITLYCIKRFFRNPMHLPDTFRTIILQVKVPKDLGQEKEKREFTKERVHELISQTEEFLTSVGGMTPQSGFKYWLYGRQDHVSCEIVVRRGVILFYVTVPLFIEQYIEQQIHAQFPKAEVERVEDYNIFSPTSVILGGRLVLNRESILPIKQYRQFESDPLDGVLNSLSKVSEDEGVAIQVLVRSAERSWRKRSISVAQDMHQGKKMSEALSGSSGGFFKFFFSSSKKSDDPNKPKEQYRLSPMEEEVVKNIEQKASRAGLETNISILVSTASRERSKLLFDNITNAFAQYNIYEFGNGFKLRYDKLDSIVNDFIYRNFNEKHTYILNTEEVASIFHFPLPITETPNIVWLGARSSPPPSNLPDTGLILGKSVYRGNERLVRLGEKDRMRHLYIIGGTGTGKSYFMSTLAIQDIKDGHGIAVVDPHGSFIEDYIMPRVPKERYKDVIYFDPSDTERPIGLNMLEAKNDHEMDFVTQEMIAIFYKLVTDPSMIGPMFEHNMRNAMFTLMADKRDPGTIAEIPRMFTDEEFQRYKLKFVTDPLVRQFWEKEMAQTNENTKSEMLGYLISKVGRFIENSMMRNIIGQPYSGFNIRDVMDNQKILFINLSKGRVGDINANLLGLIFVSKILQAALSRADMPEKDRKPFYLYIDEFQNFITDSIATILSEARKYQLGLIIAHQYIGQLSSGSGVEGKQGDTKVRDAIFGNVGTLFSMRVGVDDSEFLAKQFAPVFTENDLMNMENQNAILRLLINGFPARPFNIKTFPLPPGDPNAVPIIKELSRMTYGRSQEEVEAEIMERSQLGGAGQAKKTPLGNFDADFDAEL